jgi:hypothetical protein
MHPVSSCSRLHLTRPYSRRPPASAALPLPAAADAGRCYDFQCQALAATFFRPSGWFLPFVQPKRRRPSAAAGEPAEIRGVGPPSVPPSGAGLARGASRPVGLFTPTRGAPHRGGVSSAARGKPAAVCAQARSLWWPYEGTATSLAMAPSTPTPSRAMATTTWFAGCPRALRRRSRWPRLTWAFQLRAWISWGWLSRRSGRGRLPGAGERDAQAPSTRARRAGVWPVVVSDPWRRVSPGEDAAGISPTPVMRCLGLATRVRSPRAATRGTAPVHGTPRRAWRASPPGGKRQEVTWAWRAWSRRWRRAGCA